MFENYHFGPWAPVLGPPYRGPDAPVKQMTCPFSHEWLFFWILYLKYLTMYFLEEEIHIFFILGPLVNLYARPLPPGLSEVVLGTDMNILSYLPVNCIKHNVIVRRSTSGSRIEDFCKKYLDLALKTVPMGPMEVMCAIWTTLNPLPLKSRRTAVAHLSL